MAKTLEEKREYQRKWREANREKIRARAQAWRDANREHVRKSRREWCMKNYETYSEYCKRRYQNNRERLLEASRNYKATNYEAVNAKNLARYHANRDELREKHKSWSANNKHIIREKTRRRDAAKAKRVPKWLDKDDLWLIKEIYRLAVQREKSTGIKWHVDHIIPLQGKTVSGLHVPSNLQVITWLDNIKKGNRYNDET